MSEIPENKLGACEVCQQKTEYRCSSCKLAFYCTPQHQKEDWHNHRKTCRAFEVSRSEKLGKFLRAKRDLGVGDVIFTELPLVFGPKPHRVQEGPIPCVGCCLLIDEKRSVKCPECLWPACNMMCSGLKDFTKHGLECQVLRLRNPASGGPFFEYFRFDVLITLRALLLQKARRNKWEQLVQLEAHSEERGPGSQIYEIVEEKANFLQEHILKPLKIFEEKSGRTIIPDTSTDLIHKIYGILDVNATELNDEVEAEVLYPTASLIEHDCTPNTSQVIDTKGDTFRITFRAATPIKKRENIKSTYTHILWGTHARRQHLKETKYFWCYCHRCKDPTEFGTYLSALKCLGTSDNPCDGIQLPRNPLDENPLWVCDKCNIALPYDEIRNFIDHLGGEVENVLESFPTLQKLEDLIEKFSKFLHPNHYHIYQIKHTLVQMFNRTGGVELSNNFLMEKIKMCEELLDINEKVDPGCSRLTLYTGVLLHEIFTAKFDLLIRGFGSDKGEADIAEVVNIVKKNKNILRWEGAEGAGKKLLKVVQQDEDTLKTWLTENGIAE